MNEYLFKVLPAKSGICTFHMILADNIKEARIEFAEMSAKWESGWGLLCVYRAIS